MGIKTGFLESELMESAKNGNFVECMEILSKDKKLAGKYLDTFVNEEFFPEIAQKYVESMGEIIGSNNKSSDNLYQLFRETRLGLQNYLNDNVKDLTPEDRKYVGEQIMDLNRLAVQLDKDNKTFLLKIAGSIGGALAFVGLAVAKAIANKNENNELANDDEEDYIDADYEDYKS